jgi:hypothetical protein
MSLSSSCSKLSATLFVEDYGGRKTCLVMRRSSTHDIILKQRLAILVSSLLDKIVSIARA